MRYVSTSIIHRPERQHPLWRALWGLVTLGFWGVFLYLWWPLLTLILWALGLRLAFLQLQLPADPQGAFVLRQLLLIACACMVVLLAWAEYNRRRFQDRDQRRRVPALPKEQIARGLGASAQLAARLSTARIATVQLDEQAIPRQARLGAGLDG